MAISLSALIVGCSKDKKPSNKSDAEIILNQTEISAVIGDKANLKVTNAYKFDEIEWSTDNENVAKVDQNGVVEAFGVGSTKIKATANGKTAECQVQVGLGNTLPRIMIENERSEYRIGKSSTSFPFNVYVAFNGKTFYDVTVEYVSSNEDVVMIDGNNVSFTVKGEGQAEITLNATWRGLDVSDAPSLIKTISVSVVDEIYFYVNGRQYSNIELYTVNNFEGVTYDDKMPFVPSIEINGQVSEDVTVEVPNFLTYENQEIVSEKYGFGKIIMSYIAGGKTYSHAIDITVIRPESEYEKNLDYFSTFTGTFKDKEDDYKDKTVIEEIFGNNDVDTLKVYQGSKELTVDNGKLFGLKMAETVAYKDMLRVETDKVAYNVNVKVYTLVVQSKEDLKHFDLKILSNDNPETKGYDDTEFTFIDGYCELINNVDASGIKIEHSALNTEYDFVDANGETVKKKLEATRYGKEDGVRKFGFAGIFNGNGYTISNLDTSVESGKIGGGLFGYVIGGATIQDLALTNANITNSSGITYGMLVPTPTGRVDENGLRCEYSTFKDIYISLSEETVNPQGALMWRPKDHWMGLYNLTNIIVDARGVNVAGAASGLFMGEGTTFYKPTTYLKRNNIYVITDSLPVSAGKDGAKEFYVYGENEANGIALNTIVDGNVYTSGVKRYDTLTQFMLDDNDYSSFSSSWNVTRYPVFKTAFEVLPEYEGQFVYDATIVVNSTTDSRTLELVECATGKALDIEITYYDEEKLSIDNGHIKLVNEVTAEESTTLTVNYEYKGKTHSMEITVRLVPSNIVIDEEIQMSAYSGQLNVSKFFENAEIILAASQVTADGEQALKVESNGLIKGVAVKVKADYSDVEYVTLKVTTNITTYTFTKVKTYSHIIKTAEDLSVFARTDGASRTTGYYILANNVDMAGGTVTHSGITCGDTTNVFQGVFDGQGYSIIGFKPTHYGLFGSVYSDTEENGGKSIIRNVGFVGVQSPARLHSASDGGFTILGRYVNSAKEGVVVEVTNVHVEIRNTYLSNFSPAPNYHGLFESNSAEKSNVFNNFKMTNVYVEIVKEEYQSIVGWYHGTILSRDHLIVNSTLASRSARFDNVVSVSKASPLVYRAWDGNGLATKWGIHMYFAYAENDVGKEGLSLDAETSPHNPIAYDKETDGCYIYNNVYRYDTAEDAATAKKDGFIETGYWELFDGTLKWKKAPVIETPTGEGTNFNPDWLGN